MNVQFKKRMHGNMSIVKLFERGTQGEFATHILRYGDIITDTEYDCKEGYYKGLNRTREVFIDGLLCSVRMNNGVVRETSCSTTDKYDRERIIEYFNSKGCV